MTPFEAFEHFMSNRFKKITKRSKDADAPKPISRAERNRIMQCVRDRERGELGTDRIVRILRQHAPDDYTIVEQLSIYLAEPV